MAILKVTDENSKVGAVSGSVPICHGSPTWIYMINRIPVPVPTSWNLFLPVLALLIDKRLTAHRLFCFNFSVNFSRFKLPSVHWALLPVPPFSCPWTWKVFLQVSVFHASPWNWQGLCYSVTLTVHSLGVVQQRVCGVERLWCGVAHKMLYGLNKLWCGVLDKLWCGSNKFCCGVDKFWCVVDKLWVRRRLLWCGFNKVWCC